VGMVLRHGLALATGGLAIGLLAAGVIARWSASLLYGVQPRDPVVFAEAALVLVVSAVVAAVLPARRAASIDPARALRAE